MLEAADEAEAARAGGFELPVGAVNWGTDGGMRPLFAALTGEDMQVGYQRLVENRMGVSLAKGATRTDWLKRPLSEEQLLYAEDDVKYLPELAEQCVAHAVACAAGCGHRRRKRAHRLRLGRRGDAMREAEARELARQLIGLGEEEVLERALIRAVARIDELLEPPLKGVAQVAVVDARHARDAHAAEAGDGPRHREARVHRLLEHPPRRRRCTHRVAARCLQAPARHLAVAPAGPPADGVLENQQQLTDTS